MTSSSGPPPRTSDMLAVHRALSSALKSAPDLVGSAPAGDVARAGLLGSYYDNVLRFLEVHHSGEDELLTPVLQERCAGADAATVLRVAAQHGEVHQPARDADAALRSWVGSAGAGEAARVVAALGTLDRALDPHLRDEEAEILPLAATHMTAQEWGALAEHGLQQFSGDSIWLILGLILEQMDDSGRAAMLEKMPPPLVEAWRGIGSSAFEAFIGEVRGTS